MSLLPILLFIVVGLGHTALMIGAHNWWYGLYLPRYCGKVVHLVFGAATVALPLALLATLGWDLTPVFAMENTSSGQLLLAGYLAVCVLMGAGYVPAITLYRLQRRQPACVLSVKSEIVSAEKVLGYNPTGRGKSQMLATLPGNQICTCALEERTLRLARLPAAWDGLTILHLSDLHLCGTPDRHYFRVIMERCAAWEPDLVALTGDIADSFHHQGWIVPALSWLRWKVAAFAILGNHDHWFSPPFIRRRLERLGFRNLPNIWQQLEVRGQPLVVIGHEGPWLQPPPDLEGCPREPFRLCLSHTPDNIRWAQRAGVDLMLSGHVHGGQIRLPIVGSLLVPSRYGRRYDCGTFHEPPTVLQVSRGIGGDHPVRYGCRPEATLLILRSLEATPKTV